MDISIILQKSLYHVNILLFFLFSHVKNFIVLHLDSMW